MNFGEYVSITIGMFLMLGMGVWVGISICKFQAYQELIVNLKINRGK